MFEKSQELCPYCFSYFSLGETPFRCTSPPMVCKPEQDGVLAKIWNDSSSVGVVLPPASGQSTRCANCGHTSTKRLCPHCHMDLPHTVGTFRNYIFAVIGAKEAGKSHYLAVLIDMVRKRLGPEMNFLLEPLNDETMRRYKEQFYNPVFREGRVILGTKSALSDNTVQKPLVYSLTFSERGFLGGTRIKGGVVLVFFDTAGEDLVDEDVMSTVNKYIYRSDGVILLVDPLQLPRVRDLLGNSIELPTCEDETSDILVRTTRLIEKGRGLKPTDRIPIPLAVAFSKFDAVGPLLDPQLQLAAVPRHDGGFDGADFTAVNEEMMVLLEQWDGAELVHFARTRYASAGFFGLSALGCNPHGTGRIPRVVPRRVEDPFLWLLAENNLIPRVKRR